MHTASGYIRHFIACNQCDLTSYVPFYIDQKHYGFIKKMVTASLFSENGLLISEKDGLALAPHFKSFEEKSGALGHIARKLSQYYGQPLRNEMYAVAEAWGDEPVAQLDRAAVPWLGIQAFGVHINGFVRRPDGLYLWVGERAASRAVEPLKLDNLIGGGQPIGLSLEENLCKEAKEEAGMDRSTALSARPVRTLSYQIERQNGLRRDSLFLYDLELPEGFVPCNTDGEVAAFHLMSLPQVATLVHDTDQFKFNCNLVVIDFMMRHGFITPQNAEYAELQEWLKTKDLPPFKAAAPLVSG